MGKIKQYTFTLEEDVVKKFKEKLYIGQKLSPIINELLKDFIKKQNG